MSTEPCGSLPVTGINLSVSYCHHHMAWSAVTTTHHQTTDADVMVLHSATATFGPFDSWADVRDWCVDHLFDPSVGP